MGSNWSSITKVKVYTNISSNLGGADAPIFIIPVAYGTNRYILGSDPTDINNYLATTPNGGFGYLQSELTQAVAGTVPAPGVTANVGDPGTLYGIFTLGVDYIFPQPGSGVTSSFVGDRYVGVGVYESEPCDDYESLILGGRLRVGQVAVGVKFRFFFEYM